VLMDINAHELLRAPEARNESGSFPVRKCRSKIFYWFPCAAPAIYKSTFSLFTSDVPVSTNSG
jgi:hypothetical protein